MMIGVPLQKSENVTDQGDSLAHTHLRVANATLEPALLESAEFSTSVHGRTSRLRRAAE
jgi:hypothetical protein